MTRAQPVSRSSQVRGRLSFGMLAAAVLAFGGLCFAYEGWVIGAVLVVLAGAWKWYEKATVLGGPILVGSIAIIWSKQVAMVDVPSSAGPSMSDFGDPTAAMDALVVTAISWFVAGAALFLIAVWRERVVPGRPQP